MFQGVWVYDFFSLHDRLVVVKELTTGYYFKVRLYIQLSLSVKYIDVHIFKICRGITFEIKKTFNIISSTSKIRI